MNSVGHRQQLGHVGLVVGLAPPGADPLVDGDGHVAAVEREHRQHVEDARRRC